MKYICPMCNKEFNARPARQKRNKLVYCSKTCYWFSLKGSKRSPEVCKIISEATKGEGNPFYGKKHSDKTKRKISLNRKGKYFGDRHHMRQNAPTGKNAYHYKNGTTITNDGKYIWLLAPEHPHANKKGYVRKHRLVAEEKLGRCLTPIEVIHHINGNTLDNRPGNLYLFANQTDHSSYHQLIKRCPEAKITQSNL